MKRFVRNLVLTAAVAATALAAIPAANAQDRYGSPDRRNVGKTEQMIGIGVIGLTAGIIAGTLIGTSGQGGTHNRNPRPRPGQDRDFYPAPPPAHGGYEAYYEQEGPRYRGGYRDQGRYAHSPYAHGRNVHARPYEAWSPEWYRWCSDRYRSFNARTGTFTTYGGEQRFCVVQ